MDKIGYSADSNVQGASLESMVTPFLVVEKSRLTRNLERMSARMKRLGVDLRPHVKTTKSAAIARLATAGHSGAITVSTLREAEYFAERGFTDILYAVGIVPSKLERVAGLQDAGVDVTLLLDDAGVAARVAAVGRELDRTFQVLIEVDSDGHRAGVPPTDTRLVDVARAAAENGSELRGVLTHAGESYHCSSLDEVRAMAERERAAVVEAADRIAGIGLDCPVVSVGSTPTCSVAENLDGVTEARPGNYMFFDLFQAGLGVCGLEDIAVSVVGSIIGHQAGKGWAITDAGALALSKDRSTAMQAADRGYGLVCDVDSLEPLEDCVVSSVNQEHGMVSSPSGRLDVGRFPIGSRVRVLPNHSCITAAAHEWYAVVEHGRLVASWDRCNGW